MYQLLKSILFQLDAEKAHYLTMDLLKVAHKLSIDKALFQTSTHKEVVVGGILWKNPVGLAAGFDKNALWINELSALGFGCIEIGTVTPRPQVGNYKPRLFRFIKDEAILNRMGFNNDGMEVIATRLENLSKPKGVAIGGNIGKNKDTPNDEAHLDYLLSFKRLYNVVDYFVVNVSSPNTPNLRALQDKDALIKIISELQNNNPDKKSIFLKIAPDLSNPQLDDIISLTSTVHLNGIISHNTTLSREGLSLSPAEIDKFGMGGISGSPLRLKSREILTYLKTNLPSDIDIISSGGIMSAEEASWRLRNGAKAIQLYTGFIYKGPALISEIINSL
jgi:dihydroorotate dehydrogenase